MEFEQIRHDWYVAFSYCFLAYSFRYLYVMGVLQQQGQVYSTFEKLFH